MFLHREFQPDAPDPDQLATPTSCPECGSDDVDICQTPSWYATQAVYFSCSECGHEWGFS